jgi:hypothetical protein
MEIIQQRLRDGTYNDLSFQTSSGSNGYWKTYLRFQMELRTVYGMRPKSGMYCACEYNPKCDFMLLFDNGKSVALCCFPRLALQALTAKTVNTTWPMVVYRDRVSCKKPAIELIATFFEEVYHEAIEKKRLQRYILSRLARINDLIVNNTMAFLE